MNIYDYFFGKKNENKYKKNQNKRRKKFYFDRDDTEDCQSNNYQEDNEFNNYRSTYYYRNSFDRFNYENDEVIIKIPDDQYKKIMSYVMGCEFEIAGYASVKNEGNNIFTVEDVYVCDQLVSGAHAILDQGKVAKLLNSVNNDYIKDTMNLINNLTSQEKILAKDLFKFKLDLDNLQKKQKKLLLQWHSHVEMPAYASATDKDTGNLLVQNKNFYLMAIFNKRYEHSGHAIVNCPVKKWFENIKIDYNRSIRLTEEEIQIAKEEIKTFAFDRSTHGITSNNMIFKLPENQIIGAKDESSLQYITNIEQFNSK